MGAIFYENQKLIKTKLVTWNKYKCKTSTTKTYYNPRYDESSKGNTTLWGNSVCTVYASYTFDSTNGFVLTEQTSVRGSDALGYYDQGHYGENVELYGALNNIDNGYYCYTGYYFVCDVYSETKYSKGSTIGTVTAKPGELPEQGTLIEGSANGSYCVIKIKSTYYYYTKQ
jgi:hypothetical protein